MVVDTGPAPTLQSVETAFSALGLDRGDFVVEAGNQFRCIFVSAANLTHDRFHRASTTAFSNRTGCAGLQHHRSSGRLWGTLEFLANQNRVVENFSTSVWRFTVCLLLSAAVVRYVRQPGWRNSITLRLIS